MRDECSLVAPCLCLRVGQQDVDIKLSGHFIKEIHCVFVSETNEQGEGETPVPQYETNHHRFTWNTILNHIQGEPWRQRGSKVVIVVVFNFSQKKNK